MAIFKGINLALAFLLELVMLVVFGYWGFHTGSSTVVQWILGLGVPAIAIVIWSIFQRAEVYATTAAHTAYHPRSGDVRAGSIGAGGCGSDPIRHHFYGGRPHQPTSAVCLAAVRENSNCIPLPT